MQIRKTTLPFYTVLVNEEQELEVTVRYTYSPPIRGQREKGSGLPLEPDSPAEVEVLEVLLQKEEYAMQLLPFLSDAQVNELEEKLLEEVEA